MMMNEVADMYLFLSECDTVARVVAAADEKKKALDPVDDWDEAHPRHQQQQQPVPPAAFDKSASAAEAAADKDMLVVVHGQAQLRGYCWVFCIAVLTAAVMRPVQ